MQCLRRLLGGLHAHSSSLASSLLFEHTAAPCSAASIVGSVAPQGYTVLGALQCMATAERLPGQRSMHTSGASSSNGSNSGSSSGGLLRSTRCGFRSNSTVGSQACSIPAMLGRQGALPAHPTAPLSASRGFASRYTREVKARKRRLNNRVSWAAARPFLGKQQPGQPGYKPPRAPLPPAVNTTIPPLPEVPEPQHVQRIGRMTGRYKLAPQAAFAVVQLGPFQYKVTADDVVFHPRLHAQGLLYGAQPTGSKQQLQEAKAWRPVEVNEVLQLGKVLLWGDAHRTVVGRPYVPGAHVVAVVEEQFKDAKVQVYKKQKRKRHSKRHGHRSLLTTLRILEVHPGDAAMTALQAGQTGEVPLGGDKEQAGEAGTAAGEAQLGQQQQQQERHAGDAGGAMAMELGQGGQALAREQAAGSAESQQLLQQRQGQDTEGGSHALRFSSTMAGSSSPCAAPYAAGL